MEHSALLRGWPFVQQNQRNEETWSMYKSIIISIYAIKSRSFEKVGREHAEYSVKRITDNSEELPYLVRKVMQLPFQGP